MNTDAIMREVKRKINEATSELDTEPYCWFMLELADWCNTQADMQEYSYQLIDEENEY